jgi:hypothetical protein
LEIKEEWVVPRDGIEPPTRGFSVLFPKILHKPIIFSIL